MFGRKITAATLGLAIAFSSQAFGDNYITVGSTTISGSGLMTLGMVSTSTADKGSSWEDIGVLLIVFGSLVNLGTFGSSHAATLPGPVVWDAVVRSSRVYAANPSLIKDDSQMANAAKALSMSGETLANLILDVDATVRYQRDTSEIASLYRLSESQAQTKAFNNMVTLASMK